MKILLGLDTSPLADETLSHVCRATWPAGTSVVVLSVIGPNDPETDPNPVVLASVAQNLAVLEAHQVRTHQEILARAERALRAAGLTATTEVAYGDPRQVLVDAARSHAANLIVVGSHGHSTLRRFLMGSVASHVVAHAPCSALVVRHVRETGGRGRQA